MSYTPSLEEVISLAIEDRLLDVNTCLPAIVESYDATKQTASVKIALKRKYDTGEVGERPIIPDIPVLFPKGKKFSFTFPLQKGDDVQLIFSQRSVERWRNESGISDPKDARKFHLSDAFIIPSAGRDSKPIAGATADKTRLVNDKAVIELQESGTIIVKNDIATIQASSAGKFKITGASGKDLLKILDALIASLQTANTLTALGPQPLMPTTQAELVTIKNDLLLITE
jgi:hypothetical protein